MLVKNTLALETPPVEDASSVADGALLQFRASDQKFVARNQLDTTTGTLVFNGGNF